METCHGCKQPVDLNDPEIARGCGMWMHYDCMDTVFEMLGIKPRILEYA